MFENIMMSLRMKQGMNIHAFEKTFQTSFIDVYGEKIKPLMQKKLVEIMYDNNMLWDNLNIDFLDDVPIIDATEE